jgi:hypothetical protein
MNEQGIGRSDASSESVLSKSVRDETRRPINMCETKRFETTAGIFFDRIPLGIFKGGDQIANGTFHGGDEVPAGTFHGGDDIPAGTFHGGDEVPSGTFHSNN